MLWDLGWRPWRWSSELIREFGISCELGSGNLHVAASEKAARELREEVEHLHAIYNYGEIRYVENGRTARDELGAGLSRRHAGPRAAAICTR
jgi:gamma-glutamylputrescine oxidase